MGLRGDGGWGLVFWYHYLNLDWNSQELSQHPIYVTCQDLCVSGWLSCMNMLMIPFSVYMDLTIYHKISFYIFRSRIFTVTKWADMCQFIPFCFLFFFFSGLWSDQKVICKIQRNAAPLHFQLNECGSSASILTWTSCSGFHFLTRTCSTATVSAQVFSHLFEHRVLFSAWKWHCHLIFVSSLSKTQPSEIRKFHFECAAYHTLHTIVFESWSSWSRALWKIATLSRGTVYFLQRFNLSSYSVIPLCFYFPTIWKSNKKWSRKKKRWEAYLYYVIESQKCLFAVYLCLVACL